MKGARAAAIIGKPVSMRGAAARSGQQVRMTPFPSPQQFPTTVWSVVRAAKDRRSPGYLAAMNRLAAGYWRPVFYFLRAKGYPLERAEDLTQEFFLQFVERDWMAPADPRRGRFRSFLLAILVRFLSDQGASRAPKQRQFDEGLISISALMGEEERRFEPPAGETPQDIFMKQWAAAIVHNVRTQLEAWCRDQRRPDWWAIFNAVHFPSDPDQPTTQQALAQRFRVSRDQVRYALQRAEQQFADLLQAEVAEQVGPGGDIESEIREIERLLEG